MVKTGPKPRTFEEILVVLEANSITNEKGCKLWQGHVAGEGYGVISWQGVQVYIHRLVYAQCNEEEPEVVRHTCDMPRCWNKDHLLNGSHEDNIKDKVSKDRHCYGTGHYRALLNEDDVREIRASSLTQTQLVKKYGITRGGIHGILTGRTWKHVT